MEWTDKVSHAQTQLENRTLKSCYYIHVYMTATTNLLHAVNTMIFFEGPMWNEWCQVTGNNSSIHHEHTLVYRLMSDQSVMN